MPEGQWLMDQYAAQTHREFGNLGKLECNSDLGRYLADHSWSVPYCVTEHLILCQQCKQTTLDVYSPVWSEEQKARLLRMVGWCHGCRRLSLVPAIQPPAPATEEEIRRRLPRNAAGDLRGSLADFYFRERE